MAALRRLDLRAGVVGWAALMFFASAGPARADTLTVGATSWSQRGSNLNTTPPTETLFQALIGTGPGLWVVSGLDTRTLTAADAALKYDISPISTLPQGATIDSATFTFHVAGTQSVITTSPPTASLLVWGSPGSDSAVISLSDFPPPPPSGPPPSFTTIATIAPPQIPPNADLGSVDIPFSFDVSGIINSLATSHTPFAVFGFEAGGNVGIWNNTKLTVEYTPNVPEPPGVLLLGLGVTGVLVVAQRRRAAIAVTRGG